MKILEILICTIFHIFLVQALTLIFFYVIFVCMTVKIKRVYIFNFDTLFQPYPDRLLVNLSIFGVIMIR